MKLRVGLDEETMKRVANLTGGEYFHAGSSDDLMKVYESLKARLALETKEVEASALFAI
jgi:Ca-activated chloride channel homolog